jgi:hypothetical protein
LGSFVGFLENIRKHEKVIELLGDHAIQTHVQTNKQTAGATITYICSRGAN